jgi:hypothetical protein
MLDLELSNEGRGHCPACTSSDDRALEIMPETNSFRCWAAPAPAGHKCLTGDCIGLYAHIQGVGMYPAAAKLSEQFRIGGNSKEQSATTMPSRHTAPQAPAPQKVEAKPERSFDPISFAAKLAYSEEVKALGLSEDEAKSACVGFYKGHLYVPGPRRGDGVPRGWWKLVGGKLVAPASGWLPDSSNVVALRRA